MSSPTSVFLIDPPERLDPPTDTSLALMRESLRRGHRVLVCSLPDLRAEGDRLLANVRPVGFPEGEELFSSGHRLDMDLGDCDALYMRKDPPVDLAYLHATFLLDLLPPRVLQVNPAKVLRNFNEKLIPLLFPGLMPESVATASPQVLSDFLDRVGEMVVKPLEDCSGRGIVRLGSGNPQRRSLIAEAVQNGSRFVQGQRFLPAISEGDKRILMLGGEILGWVRRLPAEGEFRSNVNAGGRCVPCELTGSDRAICARLGPWLAKREIHLAGVDIVGDRVLEVNVTSPSCLREMNELYGVSLEERIVDYVESRLQGFSPT